MQWKKRLQTPAITKAAARAVFTEQMQHTAKLIQDNIEELEEARTLAEQAGDDVAASAFTKLIEKARANG